MGADAIILGCVSRKRDGSFPARDLYDSPLWARRRRYADASGLPWVIYSGKHGILDPGEVVGTYDLSLRDCSADERRQKGASAAGQLAKRFGSLDGMTFEIHAGSAYRDSLEEPLRLRGARLENPVVGLGIGQQLHWYDDRARGSMS